MKLIFITLASAFLTNCQSGSATVLEPKCGGHSLNYTETQSTNFQECYLAFDSSYPPDQRDYYGMAVCLAVKENLLDIYTGTINMYTVFDYIDRVMKPYEENLALKRYTERCWDRTLDMPITDSFLECISYAFYILCVEQPPTRPTPTTTQRPPTTSSRSPLPTSTPTRTTPSTYFIP